MIRLLIVSLNLLLISECLSLTAYAQMGAPKAGSPLYNSRPYSPSAPNGLPKALDEVGIDQKLNEQLPLDLVFRDENGQNVRPPPPTENFETTRIVTWDAYEFAPSEKTEIVGKLTNVPST